MVRPPHTAARLAALVAWLLIGGVGRAQDRPPADEGAATGIGELRRIEKHDDWAWGVALSPDGWRVLSVGGGPDHTARVWDLANGKELRRLDVPGGGYDVAWLPDGRRALIAGHDNNLYFWDARDDALVGTLRGHEGPVRSVTLSRDGRLAASGAEDGTARLWDLARGAERGRIVVAPEADVRAVALSPDGRWLLTGDSDGLVRLWDAAGGQERTRFAGHTAAVTAALFTPDGKRIVSGGQDKTVRLWDAATGSELRSYDGAGDEVFGLAVSPDGRRVAAGTGGLVVPIWGLADGKLLDRVDVKTGGTLDLAFTADGRQLIGGCGDGTLWVAPLPDRFAGEAAPPREPRRAR